MTSAPRLLVVTDKASIRRQVLGARAQRAPAELARSAGLVSTRLLALLEARRPRRVALYAAIAGELDLAQVFVALAASGVSVVFPRAIAATKTLDFIGATSLAALVPGAFGVPEPSGNAVPLASIDIVVQPGLAFDRRGVRLGYGAGYYDRTLARHDGERVGCCYASEWVDELPREPHDVRVHHVVTDEATHCIDHPASGR